MARRKRKVPISDDTVTAADIIAFIEQTCFIPEGKYVSKPLRLQPFQKQIIRLIYDNPHTTRRAIVSMARKNAKTVLAACLLLNHLCGPSARLRPNAQLYSAAQSRDQAGLIFNLAVKMIRMNANLAAAVRIRETAKELICAELGTTYRALSAEASTAFGLSPAFVIFDELAQCRGPRSSLFDALETATAAQEAPLTVIISTQAPSDNDLLSILIDDAQTGADPHTVLSLYTAAKELDPFAEDTIRLANPAYDAFMNQNEVRSMAEAAKRMPAAQSSFCNLVLNQRVEASAPFISVSAWNACSAEPFDIRGRDVYAGLDLSESCDLSALVLAYPDIVTGVWHIRPTFWLPEEGLYEKARADRIAWDLWRDQGYLLTTPGPTVSYEFIAKHLRQVFDEHRVMKFGFDKWGMPSLRQWLLRASFNEAVIEDRFVPFSQNFAAMSPALRELETLILERKIRHGGHPVLSMCFASAVVERDSAGNRKLTKKRSTGRIDGAIAAMMAIGVAPMRAALLDVSCLIA
jgi:phage terminase large subunit-like protein